MIEKCSQFQRWIDWEDPSPYNERQVCKAKGIDTNCGGLSDQCKYPELFKSVKGIPIDQITFPFNNPPLEELEERLRKFWEKMKEIDPQRRITIYRKVARSPRLSMILAKFQRIDDGISGAELQVHYVNTAATIEKCMEAVKVNQEFKECGPCFFKEDKYCKRLRLPLSTIAKTCRTGPLIQIKSYG